MSLYYVKCVPVKYRLWLGLLDSSRIFTNKKQVILNLSRVFVHCMTQVLGNLLINLFTQNSFPRGTNLFTNSCSFDTYFRSRSPYTILLVNTLCYYNLTSKMGNLREKVLNSVKFTYSSNMGINRVSLHN